LRDSASIAEFTDKTWGVEQRDRYLGKIDATFIRLPRSPFTGVSRHDLGPHYRSAAVGTHVIFYIALSDAIEIVRVLHGAMDPHLHLLSPTGPTDTP